jgi:hypothetical protein
LQPFFLLIYLFIFYLYLFILFAVIFLFIIYMLKYILFIFYLYLFIFIYILFIYIYTPYIYSTNICYLHTALPADYDILPVSPGNPISQPTTISAHVMRKSDYDMVPASHGNPSSQPITPSPPHDPNPVPYSQKRDPFRSPHHKNRPFRLCHPCEG